VTAETNTIGRRQALALLGGGVAALQVRGAEAAAPMVRPVNLSFVALRDGSEMGMHTVSFDQDADRLLVRSAADFAVRLGPIVLYRYTYRATETWQGGTLQAISAHTDDNGTAEFVYARRTGDQLIVTGSKTGRYAAPPGALAATHWNEAELGKPMINPQNGELMQFAQRDLGSDRLASGTIARHFALSGYASLDLWYDDARVWRALRAIASDGSVIDYRLR
jgi:hypothetical protein